MQFFQKNNFFRFFGAIFAAFLLASCDVSTPTVVGDNSVIPSNFKRVSYSELPGWREDDVRYALQAFRNSCKAKIQYMGRLIPDKELFSLFCSGKSRCLIAYCVFPVYNIKLELIFCNIPEKR